MFPRGLSDAGFWMVNIWELLTTYMSNISFTPFTKSCMVHRPHSWEAASGDTEQCRNHFSPLTPHRERHVESLIKYLSHNNAMDGCICRATPHTPGTSQGTRTRTSCMRGEAGLESGINQSGLSRQSPRIPSPALVHVSHIRKEHLCKIKKNR